MLASNFIPSLTTAFMSDITIFRVVTTNSVITREYPGASIVKITVRTFSLFGVNTNLLWVSCMEQHVLIVMEKL